MSKSTPQQENKMGVMPVNRLLVTMSVPMILSMLVQALYNVVDSMFVARLNENALTAVSLVFPIQNLMISVAAGTGVGINALLSRSLAEKNLPRANQAAVNGVFLAGLSYLAFAVFGAGGTGLHGGADRRRADRKLRDLLSSNLLYIILRPVFPDRV